MQSPSSFFSVSRLARASARRPWHVVAGWVLALLLAAGAIGVLGDAIAHADAFLGAIAHQGAPGIEVLTVGKLSVSEEQNRIAEEDLLRGETIGMAAAMIILVAVFAGFASGRLVMIQQMGFGLAVAVFLDATIVRSVLVPASMALLGDRNWYLPRWLGWLPDLRIEGGQTPATAGAGGARPPEAMVAD